MKSPRKYLYVHEIFRSISGELGWLKQGEQVVFVRFAGCNLRCSYCDTKKAQQRKGNLFCMKTATRMSVEHILKTIHDFSTMPMPVILTGGEPLLQNHWALGELIHDLSSCGHLVQIETNGSIAPGRLALFPIDWVVDFKLPSSGMMGKMLPASKYQAFRMTVRVPWMKFVMKDYFDFETAMGFLNAHRKEFAEEWWHIAFSAASPATPAKVLRWIGEIREPFRSQIFLNTQVHKLIGVA